MKVSDASIGISSKAFPSGVEELAVLLVLGIHWKHHICLTCVNENHSSPNNEGQKCSVVTNSGQFSKGIVIAWMVGND